jgi:hypothetical protein
MQPVSTNRKKQKKKKRKRKERKKTPLSNELFSGFHIECFIRAGFYCLANDDIIFLLDAHVNCRAFCFFATGYVCKMGW